MRGQEGRAFSANSGVVFEVLRERMRGSFGGKKILASLMFLSAVTSYAAREQSAGGRNSRVVYGVDERVDVAVYPNADIRNLSRSVAGRISKSLVNIQDGQLLLPKETLQDTMNVCSTERFAQQKTAVECTGFLVGPDTLVTAGHCVENLADCQGNSWIFDYVDGVDSISANNVYDCKEIVAQKLDDVDDFAVIKLDRPVSDRDPLKFRRSGNLVASDKLMVIGHPSGLPLKINDNGQIRDIALTKDYFVAQLDTYAGNSGSPVFNMQTREIEGILVRGERDYVPTSSGCSISNVCANGKCRGEDVQKITKVANLPL